MTRTPSILIGLGMLVIASAANAKPTPTSAATPPLVSAGEVKIAKQWTIGKQPTPVLVLPPNFSDIRGLAFITVNWRFTIPTK